MPLTRAGRLRLIASAVVLVAAVLFTREPIAQDQAYHRFADRRGLAGIPNAGDVLSNLPFVVLGAAGSRFAWCAWRRPATGPPGDGGSGWGRHRHRRRFPHRRLLRARSAPPAPGFACRAEALPWLAFYTGLGLTGLGSAHYHWRPDDATLLWDRLPLSATCAAFLGAALAEHLGARAGVLALPALLAFGAASVIHWYAAGDLRYYVALQACAAVVVPLLVALVPSGHSHRSGWFAAVGCYLLARLAEWGDAAVFAAGQLVSGHTLKHLLAALAAAVLLHMLRARRYLPLSPPPSPG